MTYLLNINTTGVKDKQAVDESFSMYFQNISSNTELTKPTSVSRSVMLNLTNMGLLIKNDMLFLSENMVSNVFIHGYVIENAHL